MESGLEALAPAVKYKTLPKPLLDNQFHIDLLLSLLRPQKIMLDYRITVTITAKLSSPVTEYMKLKYCDCQKKNRL